MTEVTYEQRAEFVQRAMRICASHARSTSAREKLKQMLDNDEVPIARAPENFVALDNKAKEKAWEAVIWEAQQAKEIECLKFPVAHEELSHLANAAEYWADPVHLAEFDRYRHRHDLQRAISASCIAATNGNVEDMYAARQRLRERLSEICCDKESLAKFRETVKPPKIARAQDKPSRNTEPEGYGFGRIEREAQPDIGDLIDRSERWRR